MKPTVLIKNNLCSLKNYPNHSHTWVWSPEVHSKAQKEFWDQRKQQLRNHPLFVGDLEDIVPMDLKPDLLLGFDAWNEKNGFKEVGKQNRLFDTLKFDFTDSFSNFRKKAESHLPDYYEDAVLPWDQELKDHIKFYFGSKEMFPSHYFESRNALMGKGNFTSFSSYLSSGGLDVRYLYNCVKDYEKKKGANKSTYWIIFELLWREFFYWHYQKWGRHYFSKNGIKGELDFDSKSISVSSLLEMETPEFFKAALKDLIMTGLPSNRVRQMFASIWINDLNLPWLSGADLFEKHLLDYDVYSNYGNWMYLAGVGVDSRPKRYFDIEKQMKRYDPKNEYLDYWSKLHLEY